MAGHWADFLRKFEGTLARPSRTWTECASAEVWCSLAEGAVGQILFRSARFRVGADDDAEEIVQECLAELSVTQTYDPKGGGATAFRAWVHGCLFHHIGDFFKARKKELQRLRPPDSPSEDAGASVW